MKKLYELLQKKLIKEDVGIEIECEGKGFREVKTGIWHSEDDPSLRGSYPGSRVEYVLNKPIDIGDVNKTLADLNTMITGSIPSFSFRTSVHVHVNVLNLTSDQLLSFIYTYLLLEEPLMNFCGSTRKCNRFCLRLQDADGIISVLQPIFQKGIEEIFELDQEEVRYSALNLAAINKYGSVEFRGMRGTLDVNTIDIWCNALISLRNFSCHFKNVLEVHDCYVKKGASEFFKFVLGDLSKDFEYKNLIKDMQRSYSLSIDLPYSYNSRGTKDLDEEKPNPKVKMKIDRAIGFGARFNEIREAVQAQVQANGAVFNQPVQPPVKRLAVQVINDGIDPEIEVVEHDDENLRF